MMCARAWLMVCVWCLSMVTLVQPNVQLLPTGLWVTYDDSASKPQAIVRIRVEQDRLVGHIVDILDMRADPDPRCERCPPDRSGQPLKGLRIISNMNPVPQNHVWSGGRILDPEEGREYKL